MHDEVLIDGVVAQADRFNDRAFQYGDGLFETIAVVDGRACLWDRHMDRLAAGCEQLRLPPPDCDLLAHECEQLIADRSRAVLKIYWTAGDSARGYRRSVPLRSRRILRLIDWPASRGMRGWTVRLCAHRLSENPALAGIKHLNRLDQVIARAEWDDPDIDEGIMCDQDGHLVCGTMSNLFVRKNRRFITPSVERAGIAGVVRELFIDLGRGDDVEVAVDTLHLDDVKNADALYLTNSLIGVVRVARFEGVVYDTGESDDGLIESVRAQCHSTAS